MYDGVLDDPKVQNLSADDFKAWVNLLCLASRNEGFLPSVEDMAFALRRSPNDVISLVERLSIALLIDTLRGGPNGSRIAPHNWEQRQFKSDTSTDRVKRFRQRSRNVTKPLHETAPESDTESDTEEREEHPIAPQFELATEEMPQADPFDRFWTVYPHKVSKEHGRKAFAKAIKVAPIETLLAAIENYKTSKPPDRAWANPATWLRGQRWLDEPSAPAQPARQNLRAAAFAALATMDDPQCRTSTEPLQPLKLVSS